VYISDDITKTNMNCSVLAMLQFIDPQFTPYIALCPHISQDRGSSGLGNMMGAVGQ